MQSYVKIPPLQIDKIEQTGKQLVRTCKQMEEFTEEINFEEKNKHKVQNIVFMTDDLTNDRIVNCAPSNINS